MKTVRQIAKLGFPWQTADPFLFAVYHWDNYPAGTGTDMTSPVVGNGADFDWGKPFRMYHGETVPGFPSHPHRGFETITATMSGEETTFGALDPANRKLGVIDHSDSMGNGARYGRGDVQWMTAGKGIVHSEMFPLVETEAPNHTKFFQLWLNLPAKSKMVEPYFVMHWRDNVRNWTDHDNGAKVTVWAGEFSGVQGQAPPPDSWAADSAHDVQIWHIALQPHGRVRLPAAKSGSAANRRLYFFDGAKHGVAVAGEPIEVGHYAVLEPSATATLVNEADQIAEFLVLQGVPIGEPVVQHGPFVMNTRQQIQQAFSDYQETRFGGWPWPDEAPVFPRDKGRFYIVNGIESLPPGDQNK